MNSSANSEFKRFQFECNALNVKNKEHRIEIYQSYYATSNSAELFNNQANSTNIYFEMQQHQWKRQQRRQKLLKLRIYLGHLLEYLVDGVLECMLEERGGDHLHVLIHHRRAKRLSSEQPFFSFCNRVVR